MTGAHSENQSGAIPPERQLPAPAPDRKLSIPEKRLAGSLECMNCGTRLQGPFCHYCGQPDKNFMRFFPVLMRELLEDFLDFDSRFMRTIKPLLFRPGKLTRDYLDGRRFRYVPPLRLYFFSSIAFFFVLALLAGDQTAITFDEEGETAEGIVFEMKSGAEETPELDKALERIDPEAAKEVREAIRKANEARQSKAQRSAGIETADETADETTDEATDEAADGADDDAGGVNFTVAGKPWDRETNPMVVPLAPDWVNDWVNAEIEESPQKGKEISENPNLFVDKIFEVTPATMFVLLPIVALLLKFWYLFARKYYVEHLIYALHVHSFIFVVALIMILLGSLAGWLEPGDEGRVTAVTNGITTALSAWIPIYLLISLKRVYRQGWLMTVGKYFAVGISYSILLGFATAFVALLSFVLI
jgi:hypothetical protein